MSNLKDQTGFVKKVQSRKMGIKTGFPRLDKLMFGLQPAYHLIAARPSMGKSALLMNMAVNIAADKRKVLFFSIEMPEVAFLERLVSMTVGVPAENIRYKTLSDEDIENLKAADDILSSFDMEIDYKPFHSPASIKKIIEVLDQEKSWKPDVVFIDYIQYMRTDEGKHPDTAADLTDISRSIAMLVKNYNLPFIVAAQVRREKDVNTKTGKVPAWPRLSDLKGSGCLEEDPDVVLFIHRNDYYLERQDEKFNIDDADPENTDFVIAKNRFGYPCHYKLAFIKEITKFVEFKKKE